MPPAGGDARIYAEAFSVPRAEEIERVLRHFVKFNFAQIGQPDLDAPWLAIERHAQLARALELPNYIAGVGFSTITHGNAGGYGLHKWQAVSKVDEGS